MSVDYLKDKTVYLCGAMAMMNDSGIGWREGILPFMERYGVNVLDPTRKTTDGISEIGDDKKMFKQLSAEGRFEELRQKFKPVARWDLRSVDKSDFIIVNYDAHVPSVGTWHELAVADIQKKPILMKVNKDELGDFNPWVTVFVKPENIFLEWDDLFNKLRSVNDGEIDEELWTL